MKRFCLNCNTVDLMDKHGRCQHCGSSAVVLAEAIVPFSRIRTREIEQLEEMYSKEE